MNQEQLTKELNLVFDFAAILHLNEEHGMNLLDGGINATEAVDPKTYPRLLRAGMMHWCPDITEEDAIKKIKGIPTSIAFKVIIAAVKEGVGNDEEVKNENSEDDGESKPHPQSQ